MIPRKPGKVYRPLTRTPFRKKPGHQRLKPFGAKAKRQSSWVRELREFLAHIVWCEKCGITGVRLDIAHRLKRRFITTKAEYFMAAKLCRKCHRAFDEGLGRDRNERMFTGITRLIEIRQ